MLLVSLPVSALSPLLPQPWSVVPQPDQQLTQAVDFKLHYSCFNNY